MLPITLKIPYGFLNDEVREGYCVSSEMKKVWAVELDLLNELSRVCQKYNIRYFAAGGTILGAVRHKGFIPWDDDIDIMMFRGEYERLCMIAPKEFTHPYFFQTEETDSGSYRGHAQLRNSMTTGIRVAELKQKKNINQGVFVDIFPLDNVPDDFNERKVFYSVAIEKQKKYKKYVDYMYPFPFKIRKNLLLLLIEFIKHQLVSDDIASRKAKVYYQDFLKSIIGVYKNSKTLQLSPFCMEKYTYKVEDLQNYVDMSFEMLKIPVPTNYESILKKTYGEWREYVVGTSLHGDVMFDTEKPYTEYLK